MQHALGDGTHPGVQSQHLLDWKGCKTKDTKLCEYGMGNARTRGCEIIGPKCNA